VVFAEEGGKLDAVICVFFGYIPPFCRHTTGDHETHFPDESEPLERFHDRDHDDDVES